MPSKIVWDATGERVFETGVSKGVLYPMSTEGATKGTYPLGVAWNGLTAVTESPSGAEATALYADNIKYLNLLSAEEFGATVEAYTYPDEFAACNGEGALANGVTIGQQARKTFGMSYQTKVGNDTNQEAGYKIHLIYSALAQPSEKSYSTVNDSPEAITFSWEIKTTPVEVTAEGFKPTASLVIDTTKLNETMAGNLEDLEDALYGSNSKDAWLPTPDQVLAILNGTYSAG